MKAETATLISGREAQIAELIAWGASKKYIANLLFLSVRTIENETRIIYKKIGVSKSNELSAWWFCLKYNIPKKDSPLKRCTLTKGILTAATLGGSFSMVAISACL